jgi:hypothetical protein
MKNDVSLANEIFEEMNLHGVLKNSKTYETMIKIMRGNGMNKRASLLLGEWKENQV